MSSGFVVAFFVETGFRILFCIHKIKRGKKKREREREKKRNEKVRRRRSFVSCIQ